MLLVSFVGGFDFSVDILLIDISVIVPHNFVQLLIGFEQCVLICNDKSSVLVFNKQKISFCI